MKKIISLLLAIVMLMACSMTALALYGTPGRNKNIEDAIAAINEGAKTNYAMNDMSMDEFLYLVRSFVPESLGVRTEFALSGHFFSCKNATPYKTGKVSATFEFYWNLKDTTTEKYELVSSEKITFKIDKIAKPDVPQFADVAAGAYYAEAVDWAVIEKVTSGTSETTFSPEDTCTRAQIITFLYRAYGSPAVSSTYKTNFKDIKKDDYYYKAACWAEANKLITSSKFGGDNACTRADVVTYLWKKAGSPKQTAGSQFTDVSSSASYAQAVTWAVGKGITSGVSATEFAPKATCTRGQIVTLLFRALV